MVIAIVALLYAVRADMRGGEHRHDRGRWAEWTMRYREGPHWSHHRFEGGYDRPAPLPMPCSFVGCHGYPAPSYRAPGSIEPSGPTVDPSRAPDERGSAPPEGRTGP